MPKRYYFHGDKVNDTQYYCACCDLFVDKQHFETHFLDINRERYNKSKIPNNFYRPLDSVNLFSHLPKLKKVKGGLFYRWLIKQSHRDDPIGDFSNDAQRDENFPSNTNSLNELKKYLIQNLACSEAIQTLEEAYSLFKSKNKTNRSNLPLSLRFDIFRRDSYRCQICGATAFDGVKLEIDHKIPVIKGGKDEMDNLWTLCFNCNRGKGTKDI